METAYTDSLSPTPELDFSSGPQSGKEQALSTFNAWITPLPC